MAGGAIVQSPARLNELVSAVSDPSNGSVSGQPAEVLLIDDDADLCSLLGEYLGMQGLSVTVSHTGTAGLAQALAGNFSLVVLDVMLPGMGGLEVLRKIRDASNVPVLMLTARGDDVDRIVGLEVGADDYLAKPCNARELLARIRAILRRGRASAADPQTRRVLGDIEIDTGSRTVRQSGRPVVLTSVQFDLLERLLRGAGSVIRREELAERVLGRALSPSDRSVDVHVSRLRRKLGQHRNGAERIKSVRGVGYLYARHDGDGGD